MDPRALVAPASPLGFPTPFWFIEGFKVLGFCLHVAPMNLWYAGALLAAILSTMCKGNARIVGHHIARALPFAVAFGVNFGVIPLLFIQVAYYQFFYPATILMAWPWFAVFWMVMVAYFCVYLHRLANEGSVPKAIGGLSAWASAGIFLIVGYIFANALSLMTGAEHWWGIFKHANVAGAASGFALNVHDPTLVPRWMMMFGLAITTTAAFVLLDAAFLSGRDGADYRRYAGRFAAGLYTIGLLWFAGFGSWYLFGTRAFAFPLAMHNPIMRIVFPLTAISPGLPWLLIVLQWKRPTRTLAALVGIAQFGVIAVNAVSRQWLQNVELARYADLAARPVHPQTSALVVFLALFAGGLAIVGWMVAKVVEVNRREALETE